MSYSHRCVIRSLYVVCMYQDRTISFCRVLGARRIRVCLLRRNVWLWKCSNIAIFVKTSNIAIFVKRVKHRNFREKLKHRDSRENLKHRNFREKPNTSQYPWKPQTPPFPLKPQISQLPLKTTNIAISVKKTQTSQFLWQRSNIEISVKTLKHRNFRENAQTWQFPWQRSNIAIFVRHVSFCCASWRLSPHRNEQSIGPHFSSGALLQDLNKTVCPFASCLLRAYVHLLSHFLIRLTALLENYNCTALHCAIPSLPLFSTPFHLTLL